MAAAERMQNDPNMPTMAVTTLPNGEKQYSVTRPAKQETATVTIVDPRTGLESRVEMESNQAKTLAKKQADAMQVLADCLGE